MAETRQRDLDTLVQMMTGDLQRYNFYQGPQRLGDLWTMTRDALTMRCALSTHSLGWELRLTAGKSFSRSQVCKSETEVFKTADAWRAEATIKGWIAAV